MLFFNVEDIFASLDGKMFIIKLGIIGFGFVVRFRILCVLERFQFILDILVSFVFVVIVIRQVMTLVFVIMLFVLIVISSVIWLIFVLSLLCVVFVRLLIIRLSRVFIRGFGSFFRIRLFMNRRNLKRYFLLMFLRRIVYFF